MDKHPVIGIMLGDVAGSSYELIAKVLLAKEDPYIPILFGSKVWFEKAQKAVEGAEALKLVDWNGACRPAYCEDKLSVYFYDIPAGADIHYSTVTKDSGELQFKTIETCIDMDRKGMIDGILMSPITKAAFHAAGYQYSTEFELFADLYGVDEVGSIVAADGYFRSTVVGHCAFKDIYNNVTTERLIKVGHRLTQNMQYFMPKEDIHVAIAALNPHAGEHGLFGDEEETVLMPAIRQLRSEGFDVFEPWPCDTAINRVKAGQANGIIFMYHDQGNIAQKAAEFGALRLIYVGFPGIIMSVGHGPAYGKAGKGTADPGNLIASMKTLFRIAVQRMDQ